jgi:hypothetical protein
VNMVHTNRVAVCEDLTGYRGEACAVGVVHSTMWGAFPDDVMVHDRRKVRWTGQLRAVLRARPGDAVILDGAIGLAGGYAGMALGLILRVIRPSVGLIVTDATWDPRSRPGESRHHRLHGLIAWWSRRLLRMLSGPHTHFCFLSRSECADFAAEAHVDAARVHFTPFCATVDDAVVAALRGTPTEGFIFVGGNTLRDFDVLRAALSGGDLAVLVATTRESGAWPPSVQVRATTHEEFFTEMARSSVVCLPLATDTRRSSGQQTYLNAMLLGKPVVLTDAPGVRDHVTPGLDAIVVPSEPQALRAALSRALAGGPQIDALAAAGQRTAEQLSVSRYQTQLASIARDATRP